MRLTDQEIQGIRKAVTSRFGESAKTWLFGSRADDSKRGGDIDLLIETDLATEKSVSREN